MLETTPAGGTLVDRAARQFEAFRQGDRAALDALVTMATPLLWHTARSQGVSRVGAEDVLQTVWLSLLNNADSVRDPRTIVKWLITCVRREAWRVTQRERAAVDSVDEDPVHEPPAPADCMPETVALQHSRQECLWSHVQELTPRCRQLLRVIAYADRPDYGHIAEALGMPVGSIGPTRGRCLAKLRALLDDDPAWEA